jgi:hypothetical protein
MAADLRDPVSLALDRLIDRCATSVKMAGARHRLDPASVDEVFQEVRIRVWKAFPNDPEKVAASLRRMYIRQPLRRPSTLVLPQERERDPDDLRHLYRGRKGPAVQPDHPPPEALARLVERSRPEAVRLETLDHVMSCDGCRAQFELLGSITVAGVSRGRSPGRRGRPSRPRWCSLRAPLSSGRGQGARSPGSPPP